MVHERPKSDNNKHSNRSDNSAFSEFYIEFEVLGTLYNNCLVKSEESLDKNYSSMLKKYKSEVLSSSKPLYGKDIIEDPSYALQILRLSKQQSDSSLTLNRNLTKINLYGGKSANIYIIGPNTPVDITFWIIAAYAGSDNNIHLCKIPCKTAARQKLDS